MTASFGAPLKSSGPWFTNGAYHLAYKATDGAWYVVYYHHEMKGGVTVSVWRCPNSEGEHTS